MTLSNISTAFLKTHLNLTFSRLFCFQTQNSIKNEHCCGALRDWTKALAWSKAVALWINSCFCNQISSIDQKVIGEGGKERKKEEGEGKKGKRKKNEIRNLPKCCIFPIDRWPSVRCQFWLQREHTNSQRSHYAVSVLIVNSVNEVNLINFRTGSHMTFSSIFLLTSKTSISSPKIGRNEWQSLITSTIWSQG